MFYWLNDCPDWDAYFNKRWEQKENISSVTTKTSYTTTYDGNELEVKDNITGDSLKIPKDKLGSQEANEAYKLFLQRCKRTNEPKLENKYPAFDVGEEVVVTNPNEAYSEHFAFIEKHPNLALYYQYHTPPWMGLTGRVRMMCVNSYEEDSHNKFICVIEDAQGRVWLIGENGLRKVSPNVN